MPIRSIQVAWPLDVAAAAAAFGADSEWVWLDGAAGRSELTLLARRPAAVLHKSSQGPCALAAGDHVFERHGRAWDAIEKWVRAREARSDNSLPLGPGWIGFLGFELADELESLPPPPSVNQPYELLRLGFYPRVIVLDHHAQRATAIACAANDRCIPHASEGDDPDWLADWSLAAQQPAANVDPISAVEVRFSDSRVRFESIVARALEYIGAGDIYQVNLAQRIELTNIANPLSLHLAARTASPARYGAFMAWKGGAVSCLSPELFLRLRGPNVLTAPIKGTRPLSGDADTDRRARAELLTSGKEAAELAMIVDLHRNDLGRVAAPGSVRVIEARRLDYHATVMHTEAQIAARLGVNATAIDLLRACFPAGSVTGAPKIRAMQIIRELESCPRGVYTGAIGHIGINGDMTLNVAIRTAQFSPQTNTRSSNAAADAWTTHLHVGAGIVAESDPAAEYEETLAKAQGYLRALQSAGLRQPERRS